MKKMNNISDYHRTNSREKNIKIKKIKGIPEFIEETTSQTNYN